MLQALMPMEQDTAEINEALGHLSISLPQQDSDASVSTISNGEDALGELGNNKTSDESLSYWSVVHKYEEEWQQLCRDARDADDLGELRRRALLGSLRASRFRSVSWRLLLRLLPPDPEAWATVLHDQREHYARLSEELNVTPASQWNQYFCNQELQAVIRQDVVRTFPGIDYFRGADVQEKMGMHEILAPLLFVLHSDHQVLMHSREQAPVSWEIIKVLDPQHLEADAYTLFCRIMAGIESCYRIHDIAPTSTGHFPYYDSTCHERRDSRQETELTLQLTLIRDSLLSPTDPPLAQHLQRLDIPLTLFGIRWLRLLFGREFPLQDLLVLWDAIFAEAEGGSCFELVNFIVVAMLVAIRQQLLAGDYTTCLTYLMRYPGAVDITYIIEFSLYLKYPEKYCEPATVSFPNLPVITIGGRNDMNRGPVDVKKLTFQSKRADQTAAVDKKGKVGKKKGEGVISKRLGKLSAGRWGKQQHSEAVPALASHQDDTIVEGYTFDVCQALGAFQCLPMEVEPATEAGEVRLAGKSATVLAPQVASPPTTSTVRMTVFSTSEGPDDKVEGAPSVNPLHVYS
ncbi:hypothetical protein B566_EDAN005579 [Ephemera danica]|nr:hypothetical protein B566_EDAN005579 [Ephemera danica]